MPSICHLFRLTPAEFWATPIDELQALIAYRDAMQRAREKQERQNQARRR